METNEVIELTPTEEILEIIRSGQSDQQIRDALDDYHENDIADVLPLIDKETRERLYRILGVERLSEVFTYIDDVSEYLDDTGCYLIIHTKQFHAVECSSRKRFAKCIN